MGRRRVGKPSSCTGYGRYAEGSVAETWDSIADWYAVLVRGGPGTGKTVIAVQALAEMLKEATEVAEGHPIHI